MPGSRQLRVVALVTAALAVGRVAGAAHDPLRSAFEPAADGAGERFVSRGPHGALVVAANEAVFGLGPEGQVRMELVGADPWAPVAGDAELVGRANYYLGESRAEWRTDVPRFAAVRVGEAWPGIDLHYYHRDDGGLEFDFEVAAGVDPGVIRLAFAGADAIDEDDGSLRLTRGGDSIRIGRPLATQAGQPIDARFVLDAACVARVEVTPFDSRLALVVDPVLSFSSYLGGTAFDNSRGVGSDSAGNIYVVGETNSTDIPVLNPAQPGFAGGSWDLYVLKLDPTGQTLLFGTYLGGRGAERDHSTFVDAVGNVYVAGESDSIDYPVLAAYQPARGGGLDAVVSKLSPSGALLYSTYLGGTGTEVANGIAVDAAGSAHLIGNTASTNFPTASPLQAVFGGGTTDAFVARLDATGSTLPWSSFFGGRGDDIGRGIALGPDGTVYVTGETASTDFPRAAPLQPANAGGIDAFVAHIDPADPVGGLLYSTYLGGSGNEGGQNIVVSPTGQANLTGYVSSANFPLANPSQPGLAGSTDAFLTRLAPDGATLEFSTYLGGTGREWPYGIALRADGRLLVTGSTGSTDYPLVFPVQATFGGRGISALGDAFLTEIDPAIPAVVCSTYLGGNFDDQAQALVLDPNGNALISGRTDSDTNFPLVNPFQPYLSRGDAFVAKIERGCSAAPAGVGNSLRAVHSNPIGDLIFTWVDVADAAGYRLYDEVQKSLPPARLAGESASGMPGVTIASPVEPLLYYDLRAANCCGESGP